MLIEWAYRKPRWNNLNFSLWWGSITWSRQILSTRISKMTLYFLCFLSNEYSWCRYSGSVFYFRQELIQNIASRAYSHFRARLVIFFFSSLYFGLKNSTEKEAFPPSFHFAHWQFLSLETLKKHKQCMIALTFDLMINVIFLSSCLSKTTKESRRVCFGRLITVQKSKGLVGPNSPEGPT